jgi:hypothetical protein
MQLPARQRFALKFVHTVYRQTSLVGHKMAVASTLDEFGFEHCAQGMFLDFLTVALDLQGADPEEFLQAIEAIRDLPVTAEEYQAWMLQPYKRYIVN